MLNIYKLLDKQKKYNHYLLKLLLTIILIKSLKKVNFATYIHIQRCGQPDAIDGLLIILTGAGRGEGQMQRIYILLENGLHPPVVLRRDASRNLSLPFFALSAGILHYLSSCMTANRAGGERLGEASQRKTTGGNCPFSEC